MFIAFEGPDNVGKSHDAASLASDGVALYQVTKELYQHTLQTADLSSITTFDRIDWFSHLVYRLSLPGTEWHDSAVRTVFAMPDTHLVVKMHHPDFANFTEDSPASHTGLVTETPVGKVNPMYWYFAEWLTGVNRVRGYELFRSISVVEVRNNPTEGSFTQRLVSFDAPGVGFLDVLTLNERLVTNENDLVEMLQRVESHIS